jgi:hypothetical protein
MRHAKPLRRSEAEPETNQIDGAGQGPLDTRVRYAPVGSFSCCHPQRRFGAMGIREATRASPSFLSERGRIWAGVQEAELAGFTRESTARWSKLAPTSRSTE